MVENDTKKIKDVNVKEVWQNLASNQNAVLVDVRTKAEWAYVGYADLSELNKFPIFLEWQIFPSYEIDAAFITKLDAELKKQNIDQEDPIFFICRSGARSYSAAEAMTASGYKNCHNVKDGFEGPLSMQHHRGTTAGWKAEGLPWTQK